MNDLFALFLAWLLLGLLAFESAQREGTPGLRASHLALFLLLGPLAWGLRWALEWFAELLRKERW